MEMLFSGKKILSLFERIILKDLRPHVIKEEKELELSFDSLYSFALIKKDGEIKIDLTNSDAQYLFDEGYGVVHMTFDEENDKFIGELVRDEGVEELINIDVVPYCGHDEFQEKKWDYYDMAMKIETKRVESYLIEQLENANDKAKFEFLLDKVITKIFVLDERLQLYGKELGVDYGNWDLYNADRLILYNLKNAYFQSILSYVYINFGQYINKSKSKSVLNYAFPYAVNKERNEEIRLNLELVGEENDLKKRMTKKGELDEEYKVEHKYIFDAYSYWFNYILPYNISLHGNKELIEPSFKVVKHASRRGIRYGLGRVVGINDSCEYKNILLEWSNLYLKFAKEYYKRYSFGFDDFLSGKYNLFLELFTEIDCSHIEINEIVDLWLKEQIKFYNFYIIDFNKKSELLRVENKKNGFLTDLEVTTVISHMNSAGNPFKSYYHQYKLKKEKRREIFTNTILYKKTVQTVLVEGVCQNDLDLIRDIFENNLYIRFNERNPYYSDADGCDINGLVNYFLETVEFLSSDKIREIVIRCINDSVLVVNKSYSNVTRDVLKFEKAFKQECEIFQSEIVSVLPPLQKKIHSVLEHLNGNNNSGYIILNQKDYNLLVDEVLHLVSNDNLPVNVESLQQIDVANQSLTYSFYLLHKELFRTKKIRQSFIDYLHVKFEQLQGMEKTTMKTKWSQKPKNYPY